MQATLRIQKALFLSWQLRKFGGLMPTIYKSLFKEHGMDNYNLESGEIVLAQASPVRLGCDRGGKSLEEVVLTNKNLILVNEVSSGLFSSKTYLKRCPLALLLDSQGTPQVTATKLREDYFLQALFGNERISLYFPSTPKRYSQKWAADLANAALGNLSSISPEQPEASEIADAIDEVKETFGSIFGKKPTPSHSATRAAGNPQVTVKCRGCHAPLSGRKTQTISCAYCDTKQTL